MSAKAKPGDWVRFQRDNGLVIGVVQYVREANYYSGGRYELVTDAGIVREGSVLEVRSSLGEQPHDSVKP